MATNTTSVDTVPETTTLPASDNGTSKPPLEKKLSRPDDTNGEKPQKEEAKGDAVFLERRFGLFSSVMVIIGNIIGSGIFLTPTSVYQYAGSVGMSMVVWIVCGVFSTVGALCFAELGVTIESSGAEYSYIKESFGDLAAFLVIWANLIIIVPTGQIIVALTCAFYMVEPFYPDPDCPPPDAFVRIIAVLCIGKSYAYIKLTEKQSHTEAFSKK